jgi:hypothetical protein
LLSGPNPGLGPRATRRRPATGAGRLHKSALARGPARCRLKAAVMGVDLPAALVEVIGTRLGVLSIDEDRSVGDLKPVATHEPSVAAEALRAIGRDEQRRPLTDLAPASHGKGELCSASGWRLFARGGDRRLD